MSKTRFRDALMRIRDDNASHVIEESTTPRVVDFNHICLRLACNCIGLMVGHGLIPVTPLRIDYFPCASQCEIKKSINDDRGHSVRAQVAVACTDWCYWQSSARMTSSLHRLCDTVL
jgi:hypothetical protein